MKKLKKILLINWLYFSKELIEVDDINFLTGKNGAGKSTVIDAFQIVLLGETNARNFNQAANDKSQRTLDGYLRADIDDKNPKSRRGKDFSSYIACEFCDENEGTYFVTGIVFDCHNDGSRQERFFIYDGVIPSNCFIENGEAIDIPTLRIFLKQKYGVRAKLFDSPKQYRTDMLAKWNVHSEQVTRMMKKAVSFRPIVDIQKFITENICDIPEKPDIEAMQQNIRDYKRHELLAQRQEEKLAALQEIAKLYREMQQSIDRLQQQSFLVLWAKKEDQEAKIQKCKVEEEDYKAGIQHADQESEKLSALISQKERRKEELIAACAQSDGVQHKNEQKQLCNYICRHEDALKAELLCLEGREMFTVRFQLDVQLMVEVLSEDMSKSQKIQALQIVNTGTTHRFLIASSPGNLHDLHMPFLSWWNAFLWTVRKISEMRLTAVVECVTMKLTTTVEKL